ncbi:sel1 repeat family protein [Amycolatopsis sp. K13G38]|uniref:Sel1 repeat family protein n=1 Tax=Amycolatopsis acididurans TaxID=2724524 RepID=A0ABX1J5H2_9PSEU|nr:tetratricopeptide repeat protein [Amycolatopsis acididurans]NKQ53590.1 sel1 repeat family protein [Amycolatopsis acididurans]
MSFDSGSRARRLFGALRGRRKPGHARTLRIDELDETILGVHPAWTVPGAPPLPPYVPRNVDARLDRALARGGLVLVQGDSAAGKTRSAAQAVRRNAARLGLRAVVIPRDAAELRELARTPPERTVVWLDDLERFLSTDSLDDDVLGALCPPDRRDVVLIATLRRQARDALGIDGDVTTSRNRRILTRAKPIWIAARLDEAEAAAAHDLRADPRVAAALDDPTAGLGEQIANGPAVLQRWRSGGEGAALVSAAVDLRRAGYLDPVPLLWLIDLAGPMTVPDAVAWATAPVHGASPCLLPAGEDHYVAFGYLVDQTELRPGAPEVPDRVWRKLAATPGLRRDQMFRIARAAARYGRLTEAVALWTTLAAHEDPFALFNLGWAAQAQGEHAAAEHWYTRAAGAGNGWAMTNLGTLAENRGDVAAAEAWYRRAADAGDTKGMTNLGGLFAETGRIEQARASYHRAAMSGDPVGLRKEAVLELLHGDRPRGIGLLRKVALAGDATAVRLIGLLSEPGDPGAPRSDVEALRRLAAETGDTGAALDLARQLWNEGDLDAAESWFERAADGENGKVAEFGLAVLLEQRERRDEAEQWYRRAAGHGLPEAMLNLGAILQDRGDHDEAEQWYQQALAAGHLAAEVNLGALYWRRGDLAEGQRWYRRAADRGDELAKRTLEVFAREHPEHAKPGS